MSNPGVWRAVVSVALGLGMMVSGVLAAREVTLRDGRVLTGEVVEKDGVVTINGADGLFQFPKDQVGTVRDVAAAKAPVLMADSSGASAAPAAAPPAAPAATVANPQIELKTTLGNITLELYEDDAPNTVANFITLAEQGFYDGTRLHRVIKGFMAQGGDPNSKDLAKKGSWGSGGPGYRFDDECKDNPKWKNVKGAISMANAGPNTNGSQFFLLFRDASHLDGKHTVFGKISKGLDVLDAIESKVGVETDGADLPSECKIEKATVLSKRDHKYEVVGKKSE